MDNQMTGEINYFRKRFFGGFNKKDVTDYIVKAAQERNALEAANDIAKDEVRALKDALGMLALEAEAAKNNAEDEIRALTEELTSLRAQAEAAKNDAENAIAALTDELAALRLETEEVKASMKENHERKMSVFVTAGDTFTEFESTFKELCSDIDKAMDKAMSEFRNAEDTVNRLPFVLAQAEERFEELRAAFEIDAEVEEEKNIENL